MKNNEEIRITGYLKPILLSAGFALLISTVFQLILAVAMTFTDLPLEWLKWILLVVSGGAMLVGARIGAAWFQKMGIFIGLCSALLFFLCLLLFNLAVNSGNIDGFGAIKLLVIVLSGMVGGIWGVNSRKNQKAVFHQLKTPAKHRGIVKKRKV